MNPMTNIKNIEKLSKNELEKGTRGKSWHDQYKDSAWIYIGGLNYELTEGDLICVFSQYGEVVNVNLIRDAKTGKSKGFAFICYEDQKSTVLAVDNLNGIKVASRVIRVDHVENYKVPKIKESFDDEKQKLLVEGCAPKPVQIKREVTPEQHSPQRKRIKKEKHKKKDKKKKKRRRSSSSSN